MLCVNVASISNVNHAIIIVLFVAYVTKCTDQRSLPDLSSRVLIISNVTYYV